MPLHIVIIDDSQFIRETTSKMIRDEGHIVEATFENGTSFLSQIEFLNPDLILLDIILPDITGLEILEKIVNFPKFEKIKVVMLSGLTLNNAISTALRLGAIDFLTKPISREDLSELLSKLSTDTEFLEIEKLTTIGIGCHLLTGFLSELVAHSTSTLIKLIRNLTQSILGDLKQKSVGMFIINEEKMKIDLDSNVWGNFSENEVLDALKKIPTDLKYELNFMYKSDFIDNLFEQAIMTLSSRKKFGSLLDSIDISRIGLPPLPNFENIKNSNLYRAGTSFEELDSALHLATFVIDLMGPEVISMSQKNLMNDVDVLKNCIFYYTLIGQGDNFQEGLYGPLPVSSDKKDLSSLVYTTKKKSKTDNAEKIIIIGIFYTPIAESLVSDYNKISFLIRSRITTVEFLQDIDKSLLKSISNDLIEYLL